MSTSLPGDTGTLLLEVQGYDTQIQKLKAEIEALPTRHRLEELRLEKEQIEAELGSRKEELSALEHGQHKLDGELSLLVSKIDREKEKLFSGSIMNPRELSAITAEIDSLERKRDEMETSDLEMMEQLDSLESLIDELTRQLAGAVEAQAAATRACRLELGEKEEQVAGFIRERDDTRRRIDPAVVRDYDRILGLKGGLAVVRMDRGKSCGGCHISFTLTQIDRFQHEQGVIFHCDHCRRILVR